MARRVQELRRSCRGFVTASADTAMCFPIREHALQETRVAT